MLIIVSRPKLSTMSHLTQEQRYTISRMLQAGCTRKEICIAIGKDKSVLSRELKRNGSKCGYFPRKAEALAQERKERFSRKRKFTTQMKSFITEKISTEQWSPKQIVGYCRINNIPMVSHECIYQFVRKDKACGGNLWRHTRHQLKHRKRTHKSENSLINNKISIEQRPAAVDKKERYGDWEIDTIIGKNQKGAILTMVERKTGYLIMKKLPEGKKAKSLAENLVKLMIPYKNNVHTITSDNGTEFAEHQYIADKLKTDFFFAHPYSSWERGLNEYTNKLIRQYIPKGENFDNYDDKLINRIQKKINRRPREKLNFQTPTKIFFANLKN